MALIPEERKKARRKAMQLLEHMDRTESGLYDRLRRAGFSEEAAADALAYVKSYGYIDDARYARNFISYRMAVKSRQKILQELQRKGIDRQTALNAWEEAAELEEPDERSVLRAAVEKKYHEGARLDEKELRRLHAYLARRGFRFGDISHVLEEMDIRQVREGMDYS